MIVGKTLEKEAGTPLGGAADLYLFPSLPLVIYWYLKKYYGIGVRKGSRPIENFLWIEGVV